MRPIDADGLPKEADRDKDFRLVIPECRVSRQPTIDPESLRPHGRWINIHDGNFICSCCKNPVNIVDSSTGRALA